MQFHLLENAGVAIARQWPHTRQLELLGVQHVRLHLIRLVLNHNEGNLANVFLFLFRRCLGASFAPSGFLGAHLEFLISLDEAF